jgi:sialidase-1
MTTAQTIFTRGENGYHSYRIPALLNLPGGRVLAFAEGRRDSVNDYGKIDIVLRISDDGCRTFSAQRTIAEYGDDTIGNPTPVYDRDTGRIWLFLCTNLASGPESMIRLNKAPRDVGAIYSDDRGETWSEFINMTSWLKLPGWTWYATGPCHALQMANGRIVIPSNHGRFDEVAGKTLYFRSHVILSDDHGKTWRLGGMVENISGTESVVEELADGRLYLNTRCIQQHPCRVVAYSSDGGETWEDAHPDTALPDPECQGSAIAYPKPHAGCERPLLFSNNPFPPTPPFGSGRHDLTVRMSLDGGRSWTHRLCIQESWTAYSDLTLLPDGSIACMYECGEKDPYEQIALKTFTIDELKKD